jgi:hypothetical protein
LNDSPDPLVVVGGPQLLRELVRQYAALKGWERVQCVDYAFKEDERFAAWSLRTTAAILERSKPGDTILIFLPERFYQGWMKKALEATGRLTEFPLHGLTLGGQLATLHRWIAALEPRPEPSRLKRLLKIFKLQSLLMKERLRSSSSASQPDQR